jgi:hypothetical protein
MERAEVAAVATSSGIGVCPKIGNNHRIGSSKGRPANVR